MTFITLALAVIGLGLIANADPTPADSSADQRPTLWICGDSTVRNGTPGQQGWGDPIADFFDPEKIRVVNRAIGGRSSRTFQTEGRWQAVLDEARPGDFVLIQFGHNDGIAPDNPDRPRGTLRGTGEETQDIIHPHTKQPETVHTFGWYMRKYVRDAKAKGITPILCSYIPRVPHEKYEAGHEPRDQSYARWTETVAREEGAAFIDLHAMILSSYAGMEPAEIKAKFFTDSQRDNTHTSPAGAAHNAAVVVQGIRKLEDVSLRDFLKPSAE